jgi:hypothetical protein
VWLPLQCTQCQSFHLQPMATWQSTSNGKSHHQVPAHGPVVPQRCEECGGAFKVRSPLYLYLCLYLFLYMRPCLRARSVYRKRRLTLSVS